jgi:hypothetical protein
MIVLVGMCISLMILYTHIEREHDCISKCVYISYDLIHTHRENMIVLVGMSISLMILYTHIEREHDCISRCV